MRGIGIMRSALPAIMVFPLFLSACSSTYVTPDYREYTSGGIFESKYWSSFSGGKNVRLEGKFRELSTTVLSGREWLTFEIDVPDGLRPVALYAKRKFAKQLYAFKRGDNVIVYGKTMNLRSYSREDRGFTGAQLAVELHKIEY